MMNVDNLSMLYGGTAELHTVHTQEQKCNIDINKLVVVGFLYKDEVACCDENLLACLDECVVECLYKDNNDCFYVGFLLANPLGQLLK